MTTKEAGKLGAKARAAKIAAGEDMNLGGRPKVIRYCAKCRAKCSSATAAREHCQQRPTKGEQAK